MEPDFTGYATKAGLKCSDGRTISPTAFKHMDKQTVPLVWQHGHDKPENVLGHVLLESRDDGVFCQGFFNDTPQGENSRALVEHGDVNSLSIFANQLKEAAKLVVHGMIREVSLVLAGANPGAKIESVNIRHSDGEIEELDDAAIITSEQPLEIMHAAEDATIQDVYDSMDDDQKKVVAFLVGQAAENASAEHSDTKNDSSSENSENNNENKEGSEVTHTNIFEKSGSAKPERHVLSHDDMKGIVASATKSGSLKEAVEEYALKHGIENLEILFPDAKLLQDKPDFIARRMEWVDGVISGTHHSPFSRVKTIFADITQDAARALGYIKGSYKKEEWFGVLRRTTGPTTIYKKQKLDRDDIIDITDFDVVAWMKAEMRVMLMEEIARAILIGDGRDPGDDDKIKDPAGATDGLGIRSILNDHELFVTTVNVNLDDANSNYVEAIESILRARRFYKGSGRPTFYTTEQHLTEMLLVRDETGSNRRLYQSEADLAAALRVDRIVAVEVMETIPDLVGILVNLADYNIGADRGGEVSLFDDFDIDYNQYKYLIETRISGALVKYKSAMVVRKTAATNVLVAPTSPTFNEGTGVITIPTKAGVVYKADSATGSTLTAGAQSALAAGASKTVVAVPASGYYFADNASDEWKYKRPSA